MRLRTSLALFVCVGVVALAHAGPATTLSALAATFASEDQSGQQIPWKVRYPNWFNLPEDRFVKAWDLTQPVATVNGEPVTAAEVINFLWEWGANNVINTLMVFKMIDQKAQDRGIKVTRAEVIEEMDTSFNDLRPLIPAGRTLEQELMARNTAWSRMYLQVRATIQLDKMIEAELDKRDLVHSAQIVVRIPGNTPDEQEKNREETLKAVQNIVAEIRGGLAWDEAVQKYSEDPFTKNKGGDLDWRWRDELDPKFAEAVFKLKPGEVADAIETTVGFQIIRAVAFGDQASPEEYDAARKRITEMRRGMMVRDLQEKTKMENLLVPVVAPGAMGQGPPPDTSHNGHENDRPTGGARPGGR